MTTPPIISLPPDPQGEPFVWLVLFCIGLMVGLLDYLTKGIAVDEGRWSSLPSIMQGHSWGAIMIGLYYLHVIVLALWLSPVYWWGLLLFANEDFGYWLWRYVATGRVANRLPFNLHRHIYFGWITISNIIVLLLV